MAAIQGGRAISSPLIERFVRISELVAALIAMEPYGKRRPGTRAAVRGAVREPIQGKAARADPLRAIILFRCRRPAIYASDYADVRTS